MINVDENIDSVSLDLNIENIQDVEHGNGYLHNNNNTNFNSSFYNMNCRSNSPVTIINNNDDCHGNSSNSSNGSSDSDSNNNYDTDDENVTFSINGYKKLSYRDVERMINKYYDLSIDNKFSSEIDILTTFIKAQKNLYIQSKYSTQRRLNCLMFPSLLISAFITMVAPFTECNSWTGGLISALNAIIVLCVSFINYLKLESSIENYLYNVKQYDKLESTLEMTNNKLLFIENNKEKSLIVLNKIKEIEQKISEIKESTNILIPEDVKTLFPIICNINIFSFIKKVEIFKKNLIIKFKDVKNEIRYILFKMEQNRINSIEEPKNIGRLEFLYEVKNRLKAEIFDFQCAYSHIDLIFTKEIKNAESKKNELFCFYFWRTSSKSYYKGMNPIIDKYFHFIFVDE